MPEVLEISHVRFDTSELGFWLVSLAGHGRKVTVLIIQANNEGFRRGQNLDPGVPSLIPDVWATVCKRAASICNA
jgi:hypothetical protein